MPTVDRRIGIVTIHNSPNYGASLQAFALYKFIEQSHYSCEIIDLLRPYHAEYISSKKYKPYFQCHRKPLKNRFKAFVKKIFHIKSPSELFALHHEKEIALRQSRFEDFNAQIKLTHKYFSIDDLYQNPPEYDIYISGSDQIWNPAQPYCLAPYFLSFVKNKGKKIAYASSIGLSKIPSAVEGDFKCWLSDYDKIMVREIEAKTIIEPLIHKNVSVVLDPTYLLGSAYWQSVARKPAIQTKYIFCFTLNYNELLLNYSYQIATDKGLMLVTLGHSAKDTQSTKFISILDAGPLEWLGLIQHAELVLTDSFHGTVFSTLLAKNFATYIAGTSARGSRITHLLSLLGLSSHLLSPELSQSAETLFTQPLERTDLDHVIERERQKSASELWDALNS